MHPSGECPRAQGSRRKRATLWPNPRMGPIFLALPRLLPLSLPAGSSPWHVMTMQAHASSTAASWIGLMLKELPRPFVLIFSGKSSAARLFKKKFRCWSSFRFSCSLGERKTTSETVTPLTVTTGERCSTRGGLQDNCHRLASPALPPSRGRRPPCLEWTGSSPPGHDQTSARGRRRRHPAGEHHIPRRGRRVTKEGGIISTRYLPAAVPPAMRLPPLTMKTVIATHLPTLLLPGSHRRLRPQQSRRPSSQMHCRCSSRRQWLRPCPPGRTR